VNVRNDSPTSYRGLDETVQLLVPPDGELEVAGSDPLDLEVLGGVTGQLEHLRGEILEYGGAVDGGCGSYTAVTGRVDFEVAVDTAHGELEPGTSGSGDGFSLGFAVVLACFAASHSGRCGR